MTKARESLKSRRMALVGAIALIAAMLALAAAWHWTPLRDVAEPRVIARWLDEARDEAWMPVLVILIYVVASLVMFPNTVLCLAVILALGPLAGTAYAFGGSMAAALVGYSIGLAGGKRVEKLRVRAVDRISKQLRRGGFLQVLALRVLPVAPFSVTNVLSGAARVGLLPFAAATAVGIAPYILAFGAFGRQARRLLSNPTPTDAAVAVAIVAVAAVAVWQARAMAARFK